MRDIRADLEERAAWLEKQISSAQVQFDTLVEQFKAEHEIRLKPVRAEFDAVRILLGGEDRRLGNGKGNGASAPKPQATAPHPQPKLEQAQPAPKPQAQSPQQPAPKPAQSQSQPPLADFLDRKLREVGAMPKDELRRLAVQEGYFAKAGSADSDLEAALMQNVKAGSVRQLPDGRFAAPSLLDTIRLRRAV
ncbi:MAG: hypothetical protein WBW51_11775 [Methyloceanibacter sp.]